MDAVNERRLTPLHCAAMQGRIDVIKVLLDADTDGRLFQIVSASSAAHRTVPQRRKGAAKGDSKTTTSTLPSVVYLSVVNDFVGCAGWLLDRGFQFRRSEPDRLLYKLIGGQLMPTRSSRPEMAQFLIDRGRADSNRYVRTANTGDDADGGGSRFYYILFRSFIFLGNFI